MKILSDSFALLLLRLSTAGGYLSAVLGVVYLVLHTLAFDRRKAEKIITIVPRSLAGEPMMWIALVCIAAGVLSLLGWLAVRTCTETPPASALRGTRLRLLCWLPMLVTLGLMLRSVLH